LLDNGVIAFIDDIWIYAKDEEEHDRLVEEVLKQLSQKDLVISADKCTWSTQRIEFKGYVITLEGMEMANNKVETIQSWQIPQSLKDVQSFLGFTNCNRRFINGFSRICRPLTESTKGDKKSWKWTLEMNKAFDELKKWFINAPILKHYDPNRQCILETDASDFALGAILSQRSDDNALHPSTYHSRKFTPTEINYEIHDRELLAIVDSFKLWRRYIDGSLFMVLVYSDHQNLEYFTTMKILNRRQARWAQELTGIDFKICYRPGTLNGKPHTLSRRSAYRPSKGGSEDQPTKFALSEQNFQDEIYIKDQGKRIIAATTGVEKRWRQWDKEFFRRVRDEGLKDQDYVKAMDSLRGGNKHTDESLQEQDGILFRRFRLWIPSSLRDDVLVSEHDSKVVGHMGQDKTKELIRQNFWCPRMDEDIVKYMQACVECTRNKSARHKSYDLLQPLELAYAPWQSIAMNCITDLPLSDGCDQL
jgi:hypothetical protein